MTYSVPSAATFKARHPRFAAVADATVDLYLTDAAAQVGTTWSDTDGPAGIMYLAAHLMVMEGALDPTKVAAGVGNQIKKVKAGEVETEFAVDAANKNVGLSATVYGQRYSDLAARNGGQFSGAVLVV